MNWRELSNTKKTTYTVVAIVVVAGIIYLATKDDANEQANTVTTDNTSNAQTATPNLTNSTVQQNSQSLPAGAQNVTNPTTQVVSQDFQIPITSVGLGGNNESQMFNNSLYNTAVTPNYSGQTGDSFFQQTFPMTGKQQA